MKPNLLVASASRHHATHEVAAALAAGLVDRGLTAEARPIETVPAVGGYGAVVLGSAVYMGRWLPEARRFAQIHTSELCVMPVWLFSSGPIGSVGHPIPAGEPADVRVILRLTRATGHRTFGGRLEMKHLRFAERSAARAIHAPEGDNRDWDAIERFAGEIADQLLATHIAA